MAPPHLDRSPPRPLPATDAGLTRLLTPASLPDHALAAEINAWVNEGGRGDDQRP